MNARVLPPPFPAGSGPDRVKTAAMPGVWSDAAGFRSAAARLAGETAKLAAAAKGADGVALRAPSSALGKACAACHHDYRLKDF